MISKPANPTCRQKLRPKTSKCFKDESETPPDDEEASRTKNNESGLKEVDKE